MGVLAGRRERRQWAPEPVVPPYPGMPTAFGVPSVASRPDTALVVPAVWACVQLLANAVSMLPLQTFRRTDGVPQRLNNDPAIVASPSDGMTQSEWLHMLMVSLLTRGNAYGLLNQPANAGRPTQIMLLHPDKVKVDIQDDGSVRYLTGTGFQTDITSRMWHVRGLTLPGCKVGLSPIAYAAHTIGVDLSSRKFAQDFFDGGGIPKATLTSDEELTMEQATTAKERLKAATLNREPAVFGQGIKYQAISVKPEESQFLATQQADLADIARYFNIAPEMIGGKSASNLAYTTPELRSIEFLTYGVSFWLKRIEDAYYPLLPQPQFVSFDESALLRMDAETQAKVRVLYIAGKVLPPSRILSEMNQAPLTQAEKEELELVPLTVSPTGRVTTKPNADTPTVEPSPTQPPKLGVVNG